MLPDISVGAQIFDLAFHPTQQIVYTGLLTGEVKAFSYDDEGNHESIFSLRPSKRSCRGIGISEDGRELWAVGKSKAIHVIDTSLGKVVDTRPAVHNSPINRIKRLYPWLWCTGDDDGVINLWDSRKPDSIRAYKQHIDFISDFLWLENGKQLVATSGDGTLSVMDVRSKELEPLAHSEDQEDELLSIVSIKGGTKFIVGTQLGILSIFNKSAGWNDCVDRVPGHPHSVDALCTLPSKYSSGSTILTGSSDGLLRAVDILPTKLVGIVADHGTFPVERIAVELAGEGRWVGSAGHEEVLRMTDLKEIFEDEKVDEGEDTALNEDAEGSVPGALKLDGPSSDEQSDEQPKERKNRKRKRKKEKNSLGGRKKMGRNQINTEPTFFSGL